MYFGILHGGHPVTGYMTLVAIFWICVSAINVRTNIIMHKVQLKRIKAPLKQLYISHTKNRNVSDNSSYIKDAYI